MRSLIQTATVHTVEFSKSDGITNEVTFLLSLFNILYNYVMVRRLLGKLFDLLSISTMSLNHVLLTTPEHLYSERYCIINKTL